jgi:hypothetical protein
MLYLPLEKISGPLLYNVSGIGRHCTPNLAFELDSVLGDSSSIMPVAVVDVWVVWVTVRERLVDVSVGMRIPGRIIRCMGMLVVSVMSVRVSV